MELTERHWNGIRFCLPADWTTYLVDNGACAFGPRGESFVVSQRSTSVEKLAQDWLQRLSVRGGKVISEVRASGPLTGILRITAIQPAAPRMVSQLFVGGTMTVTATYAAPATESYDRNEADAIIRSIRIKLPSAA